jgi:hypothetical protein
MKYKTMFFFFSIPNPLSINKDDLPIVSSIKKFDLQVLTPCDIHSVGLVLSCMPNLRELNFTLVTEYLDTTLGDVLLNGNIWQKILINHVPYLNKFDIHISLIREGLFDLKSILDSFRCFVTQYDDWHMAVSQWETLGEACKWKKRCCLFDSSSCSGSSFFRAFFFVLLLFFISILTQYRRKAYE